MIGPFLNNFIFPDFFEVAYMQHAPKKFRGVVHQTAGQNRCGRVENVSFLSILVAIIITIPFFAAVCVAVVAAAADAANPIEK